MGGQSSSSSAPLLPLSSLIGPILSKRQPVFFDSSATEEATFQLHYGRGHTVQLVPHPGLTPKALFPSLHHFSHTHISQRLHLQTLNPPTINIAKHPDHLSHSHKTSSVPEMLTHNQSAHNLL